MAFVLDDRVKETSTTTGTGAYTLAGAVAGFQSFAAIGDGNTTWYDASDGTNWETGIGTYTAAGTLLARTTILTSSNGDAAVNWGAGTKTIVCTLLSTKAFIGPASAGDNGIPRFDGTSGRVLQGGGGGTISDDGYVYFYSEVDSFPIEVVENATDSATAGYMILRKSRLGGIINNGDDLGSIVGEGDDGVGTIPAARIDFASDGAPGVNDMPGRIEFKTTSDGAASATERLRITSTGRLRSTTGQVAHFWVYWTGNSTTILASHNVDSVANTGTGDADITITTDFSSANWAGFVSINDATGAWDATFTAGCGFNARAAGSCGVLCSVMQDGGTAAAAFMNPEQWQVVGFGVSA